jgi:simple sugar transport system substrate-binding protein
MFIKRNRVLLAGVTALVAVGLGACTSETGGKQQEAEATGGGGAGKADTPERTVAMITHAAPGDTFWDLIRSGAEAAAAKDNIDLNYTSDPQGPKQATLVQNAIDQKVDGIAVTLAKPEAMQGAVQKAIDAGIPVVAFNAGLEDWSDMGVQMYFGQDENVAGETAGERLSEEGAQHVLCVIQEQGHVALEARCDGVAKGFGGKTENLYVQGTDMPSVRSTIANKLRTTPGIDRVLTLGAPFALTAVQSAQEAGSDAQVVTFDTNAELVKAIQSGDVQWAIDQQPYLQGYLAVDSLWLYLTNGNVIGGGRNVLTGPSFIDQDNIDDIATYAQRGTR